MSTYFYAICTKHEAVSGVIGGRTDGWWSADGHNLEEFLEAHGHCDPAPLIISEHDDRATDYAKVSPAAPATSEEKP